MHLLCMQATALKALRTNLAVTRPGNAGLTHLVIHDAGEDIGTLSQTLPLFKSLKTLSLGTNWPMAAVSFPTLHLAGLQDLSSVELDRLMPGSILLSSGCELHIKMTGTLTPSEQSTRIILQKKASGGRKPVLTDILLPLQRGRC